MKYPAGPKGGWELGGSPLPPNKGMEQTMGSELTGAADEPDSRTRGAAARPAGQPWRIVVIGAGFAGYFATRKLSRTLSSDEARVTIVSDTDAMLYQPLLPEVAVGALDARTAAVPLSTSLPHATLIRGSAQSIDRDAQTMSVVMPGGGTQQVPYDRLVIAAGSVTRMFDIEGLAEHAVGFKTVAEALYLREMVLERFERANAEPDAHKRGLLLNFVVVGAGYAGTELVAQISLLCKRLTGVFHQVGDGDVSWTLLDMAPAVMPELGEKLGLDALDVLKSRGVDVRLKTSVESVDAGGAHLTDGTTVPEAVVVWCAGVAASPLVESTGLPTTKGRLAVSADLRMPDFDTIYALGDAAAVPDLTKQADKDGVFPVCPPTAQHAMRQAGTAAANVIADVRGQERQDYRHKDLGLVVDLGGSQAVAKPLGIGLNGGLAKVVARGYHVYALPTGRRRVRAVLDWATAGSQPNDVSFGLLERPGALAGDEHAAPHEAGAATSRSRG